MTQPDQSAHAAVDRLLAGNRRFVRGESDPAQFRTIAKQQPFAVIVGCSDSRVPAEVVFDQGIGDLFVVRVAGNVVPPSVAGSVEFAVARLGTRLVVVMGHTQCGAVRATIDALRGAASNDSPNLQALVNQIRPAVEDLVEPAGSLPEGSPQLDEVVRQSVRANVRASVNNLRTTSNLLAEGVRDHGLLVVGAEYSLETGEVDFFDGLPADA